jgi:hypothetical protein
VRAVPTVATVNRIVVGTVVDRPHVVPSPRGSYCSPGSQIDFCAPGLRCVPDWNGTEDATGLCCGFLEVGCKGECRRACPQGTRLTSECECCAGCRGLGQVQDPKTCACTCPPDKPLLCDNECVDPLTDNNHCGDCPTACVPPFSKCCNGKCRPLGNKTDCRDCDDPVPAGWDCCHDQPTPLATNANCSQCDDACNGGQVCVPGIGLGPAQCQCPSNRWPCTTQPGLRCCPPGTRCCGWGCATQTQIFCGTNGVGCGTDPGWSRWRTRYPNTPVLNCATGACDPTLVILPDPSSPGGVLCCPPGARQVFGNQCCTAIVNGQCQWTATAPLP